MWPEFPTDILEAIGRRLGAQQAAFQFSAYAIIAALAEQHAIDPVRVIAWARFYAEQVAANQACEERERIVAIIQSFADGLESVCTIPEGTGRA